MPEQAAPGALLGQVPGRAHERVKVKEPVLVKLVAAARDLPVQPVVQHLGRHCAHAHADRALLFGIFQSFASIPYTILSLTAQQQQLFWQKRKL